MTRKLLMIAGAAAIGAWHPLDLAFAEDPAPAKGLLAQQGPDLWRGSKLIGINIYGPDNKKVGDVSDVLMSHDGKAAYAIIGVGGFLGIGEKDIAIPFDQIGFTDQPLNPVPAQPAAMGSNSGTAGSGTAGGGTAGGGMAPAPTTGLGSPPADTAGTATTPAATGTVPGTPAAPQPAGLEKSTAYPDHGLISLTADQLKQAPAFQYAR